jgi:hypothetical protein
MQGYTCDTLLFSELKSLSEFLKKSVFEDFFFDSLTLKLLGQYVNLVGHIVAYSQPFNFVHR